MSLVLTLSVSISQLPTETEEEMLTLRHNMPQC